MLESAGLALKALAPASLTTAVDEAVQDAVPSIENQKNMFSAATSDYFSRLYSIDVGLRTQIGALEEARIISGEAATKEPAGFDVSSSLAGYGITVPVPTTKPSSVTNSNVTGGGLGNMDVGWLNSRNDYVGKQMESALWSQASEFLAGLESKQASGRLDAERGTIGRM